MYFYFNKREIRNEPFIINDIYNYQDQIKALL